MEFLETYFNIFYIMAVVFGSNIINEYVPYFRKIDSRWTALVVSVIMLVAFYFLQDPESDTLYIQRTFVSFLASIALYDFIIKPIKKIFIDKINSLGRNSDNEISE